MHRPVYKRERGAEYFFAGEKLKDFFRSLPVHNRFSNVYAEIEDKIAIVTHDDVYDLRTANYEREFGIKSTYFLLCYNLRPNQFKANKIVDDIQFHFDKGYGSIEKQIKRFHNCVGTLPKINRNHRFWWRADHLDLAYLAMHGFKVDSTKIGIKPYKLCVESRLLPIWEVPVSAYDASVTNSVHAGYKLTNDIETLFTHEITPIVGLYHPLSLAIKWRLDHDYERFCELGLKYGYKFLTMTEFYDKYLNKADKEISDN